MGAGKTVVGRPLARKLRMSFVDADSEIEEQEGMSISEIFAEKGEPYFRTIEQRVINSVLETDPHVLASGGGAFIQPELRGIIKKKAISVWLKADLDIIYDRITRKNNRPLLEVEDKRKTLVALMEKRYPVYAEADITVLSNDDTPEPVVKRILDALDDYFKMNGSEHAE
ncbi:MAG: shikimate kinase [Alphaproteobacteria bacterium]|nr:shikimate kinase [Alphaproteobacteria bacterium]